MVQSIFLQNGGHVVNSHAYVAHPRYFTKVNTLKGQGRMAK